MGKKPCFAYKGTWTWSF